MSKSQYMQRHNNINDDRYSNSKRDSDNEFNIQRDSARVILTRTHLFASRDTPSAPVSDDLVACLICVTWSTSIDSSGSSDCDSVNKSMSFCHVMLWDLQLLYLICLPFPVVCLSDLLVTLVWHGLSVSPQDPMDCCLLFVTMDLSSVSTRSFVRDIFFVAYAERLECLKDSPDIGLSIITKWVPRFVVFGFFSVVALSGTGDFVKSTLDCFDGTDQMETSTRISSANLLSDVLSILSRRPGALHRLRPLSRVFSPCRWATTLTRTESTRLHTSFMGGSLMRTGSGLSQMSFRNRKSSCAISESLSWSCLSVGIDRLLTFLQSVVVHFVIKVKRSISSWVP